MNAKITAAELHTINVLDSNYLLDALGGGFSPPASWQECFGTLELIVMKSDWAMPIWTLPERQPPQICWDHQILLMKTMVMMLLLMMMMMRRRRRTGRRTFSSSGLKGDVAMIILLVNCGLYLAKGSKATKKNEIRRYGNSWIQSLSLASFFLVSPGATVPPCQDTPFWGFAIWSQGTQKLRRHRWHEQSPALHPTLGSKFCCQNPS